MLKCNMSPQSVVYPLNNSYASVKSRIYGNMSNYIILLDWV